MSQRIPVGAVLTETFNFARVRWLTVFTYFWLPILLIGAFVFGASQVIFDPAAINAAGDDVTLAHLAAAMRVPASVAVLFGLAGVLLMMALYAGAFASVFRLVALGEERPGIFQLRFDGPAQRVFWGQLILAVMNYGLFFLIGVVVMLASGESFQTMGDGLGRLTIMIIGSALEGSTLTQEQLQPIAGPLGVVGNTIMISFLVLAYLNLKLVPFLPGSAVENRLLFLGAFRMTRGHFWTILGVYVIFIAAMLVLTIVYELTTGVIDLMSGLAGGGALSLIGGLFGIIGVAVTVAYQVYIMGAQLALCAIIYRRITTGE
ncbi:hypothetical protein [Hyphococcus sp.]|uniref:hypothetical protein n=1 Tax=Hyphococcus sp. TaxID=2038636 RepID=UPI003D13B12B